MKQEWPALSYQKGKASYQTVHMWTQILGKIKLETLPWMNHSWHVTLKSSPTGLTTGSLPYKDQHFQISLDLISHKLLMETSRGAKEGFDLPGLSVAEFFEQVFDTLRKLNIELSIYSKPVELEDPIRFEDDTQHNSYDREQVTALHRALLASEDVLNDFRCNFRGKSSGVHFFWGSFDQAVSLFSGRKAPKHPGGIPNLADWVAQEAYSHEVMSMGFWPGSQALPQASFYCYLYPEPQGYNKASILPEKAYYHNSLREFILPYSTVQQSDDPQGMLREFLRSTYKVGTSLAHWDRESLEL